MNTELPKGARELASRYPEVWEAYSALGKGCAEAGDLDATTRRLVKLALAVGRGSEGAVHSHARRGLEEGISGEQLMQIAVLAIPTVGLPGAVAALTWILDIVEPAD